MAPRNRALFALVGLFSAIAAGCSGGSKSGGTPPTASPSSTPTATSSATGIGPITGPSGITTASPTAGATTTPFVLKTATPIPAATAPPTGAPNTVTSRPLANGDSFTYKGTTSESFVFTGTNPNPSSTSVASIVQNVAVTTNKSFNGASGLDEYATSETDTGNNAATTITTDSYFGLTSGPTNSETSLTQQALTTYGSTSTDSSGESLTTLLTNPGYSNNSGTVDLLPEERTPTWTNGIAETINESESDGFTATRTYNADGSYVENATYPQTSAASPQPTPLTATITQNSDGSGVYSLPLFSPPNITITFAKPASNGLITIVFCCDDQGQPLDTQQASAWFPQPVSSSSPLYSEIDRNNGAVPIPSSCNASTSYGTTANEVEQKYTRIDTVIGTLEFFDQLTYVADNGAAVCVQLEDTTYVYYDYSGQSNPDSGVGISGGNSPIETQTIATTLGLQSGAVANSGSRHNEIAAHVSASAVANARANFLRTVDRYRVQRERKMATHLRTVLARYHR